MFHGVYLLRSRNPKCVGRTYIGYTVNPSRREKQHNKGKDFGGAWKTSNRGPWDMVLIVHGFPNDIAALRFEWAWQHPKISRRLQHIPKKKSNENMFAFCLRLLKEMLQVPPWKRLPLTIQWLKSEYYRDLEQIPPKLPAHISIVVAPIPSDPKATGDLSSKTFEATSTCTLCLKLIQADFILRCTNASCPMRAHLICLATYFLSADEYIPVRGNCVCCDVELLWGDLVKSKQHFLNASDNSSDTDQD